MMRPYITFLLIFFLLAGCTPKGIKETGGDIDRARQSLLSFFSLLHNQQYDKAIDYFGGDYEQLRAVNPDVPSHYRDALLRQACTINGFLCMDIKSILKEEQLDSETFRFTVEFQNEDGSLFILGPCCGASEEEMPSKSDFLYTVVLREGRYQVIELPVYVP
jgi:hypothetical protein